MSTCWKSPERGARAALRTLFLATLWLFASLAAALPTDVVLVLDNSGSMRKNDPEFLLKRAVSRFVSDLGQDTRVGMVIFDEAVDYAVPLAALDVDARAALKNALEKIDYRGQYTNSPAAIERAIYELKSNGRADVAKVIIFMTDGIVDTGDASVDAEKTKWMREELAADAADNDIRVFGIAFTENADFFLIQSLAKRTDGEYFRALTPADLAGVFATVQQALVEPPPAPEPPPPPPPPPDVVPPAPPAGQVAASCLDQLVPEERQALEESAPEFGMTAAQLCEEMMQAGQGGTVVVRPDRDELAPEEEKTAIMLLIGIAALVLLVVVALVVFLLRRRGGAKPAGGADSAAAIPDAFLKDVNGITGEPAVKIGPKPIMVGRVAGNDPAHLDYYVVDKGTVGRRHAIIQYRDFSFWITDQGSVNGTFLNGERIDGERQLKHGDRVKFHKYEFEFSMPEMDDAGHTVFADPNDLQATMVGEATMIGGAADFEPAAPSRPPAAETPFAADEGDETAEASEDIFDDETALSARHAQSDEDPFDDEELAVSSPAARADGDDLFEEDMQTALPVDTDGPRATPPPDEPEPTSADVFGADTAAPQSDDDFNAEASAFFDEDELSQTSGAPPSGDGFDEDFDAEPDEAPTALPAGGGADSESETLLPPGSVYEDEPLSGTSDISLDEFMRTDSFETPLGDLDDDSEDATVMPDQVAPVESGTPAIDDVFDITGDRTVPPSKPDADDADDEEDDDSEAPTRFVE